MRTAQISFEVSEGLLQALNADREEFTQQARLFTALQLFKRHKLSLGKAAELAAMSRERFMTALDEHDIALIDYDPAELEQELERFKA
jgi:predicted HTH domain antitoxin